MTYEEYKNELDILTNHYEKRIRQLAYKYAMSNSPYQVGDIITDHIGTIKVDKIKYNIDYSGKPCCVYYGIELNKNGSIAKKQSGRGVYQNNIIS